MVVVQFLPVIGVVPGQHYPNERRLPTEAGSERKAEVTAVTQQPVGELAGGELI